MQQAPARSRQLFRSVRRALCELDAWAPQLQSGRELPRFAPRREGHCSSPAACASSTPRATSFTKARRRLCAAAGDLATSRSATARTRRSASVADEAVIVDVPEANRYELRLGGRLIGFAEYRRRDGHIV